MTPSIAELIRSGRIRKGWNQAELAEQAGVARTTLVHLERGTIQEPRASTLSKLAAALDLPPAMMAAGRSADGRRDVELLSEQARFDWATNPAIQAAREAAPERFTHLTADDWDLLISQMGVGGGMTVAGVLETVDQIHADRETLAQLQVVLQTHLRESARQVIEGLYRAVAISPGKAPPSWLPAATTVSSEEVAATTREVVAPPRG